MAWPLRPNRGSPISDCRQWRRVSFWSESVSISSATVCLARHVPVVEKGRADLAGVVELVANWAGMVSAAVAGDSVD
jgi:hypothetical protein